MEGTNAEALHQSGWPTDDPRVLALLPLVYVAWSDCDLTPAQIGVIAERVDQLDWRSEAKRGVVERWLNPSVPPGPAALRLLLSVVRGLASELPDSERRSLTDLGIELAQASGGGDAEYWRAPAVRGALVEIESALGVDPSDACRELLSPEGRRPEVAEPEPAAPFEVSALTRLLGGAYRHTREQVFEILRQPQFRYVYGLDRTRYQERVYKWCQELARHGLGALAYPQDCGGQGDIGRFIAVMEALGFHDLSLAIKFGVQFGLFGGSIHHLGTQRHHQRYLRDVGTLALPGCYAMSEAAHGSNVRDIETVARFNKSSGDFVVHTPSGRARKVYIGNAVHGRMATVFAQLEIGNVRYGVHAFLVPIRDSQGNICRGVRIRDSGEKLGLNGMDSASIWFDQVHVPRENLLNRFAYVSADGVYATMIPSDSQRFFTMLGTLVGGRIGIAAASLSAAKSGLTIAVRYGSRRRQFGPPGQAELRLLEYPSHQRRLMPALATTYALDFALRHLVRRFLAHRGEGSREVEALAAGFKAYSSWHAVQTLQTCREACGGAGYVAVNRFAALRADADLFTTFEGDNTVLMQLVAKALVTDYRQQFEELKFPGLLTHLTRQAARAVAERNPIVTRLTDESHLRDHDFQLGAFRYRESQLLVSATRRLKRRIEKGVDALSAFNDCQDHLLKLAHAHIERGILEQCVETIRDVPDADLGAVLKTVCDLFALSKIEEDSGWYLENGYIEGVKARAIRRMVNRLCAETRQQALALVDAFAIPDELLGAPIARRDLSTRRRSVE